MMMLLRRQPTGPIGIDFGASSVKLLQLCDGVERPSVAAAADVPMPVAEAAPSGADDRLHDLLTDALRRNRFRGRRVVAALGTGDFQVKNIRMPPMPADDLQSAVTFEAQDRFGLSADEAEYRCFVAGQVRQGNDLKDEVIVFAARRDVVQRRIDLLDALGLEPLAIDLNPCAMARSFVRFLRRSEDVDAVNVFVDVGWRGTSLVVTRGADACFVKLIDVGGAALSRAVAERLELPEADATALRVRIMQGRTVRRSDPAGEPLPAELVRSVADAVRPPLEQLGREIHLTLRYFSVTFRGQRPECITFVGGEAYEPSLIEIVREGLDIPCTIGNPLRGIGTPGALARPERRAQQPAWAVAAGLALRGSKWVRAARTEPAAAGARERREAPA